MTPATIILRILRFHNCEGCVRKAGIALNQIDGVELVGFDPVTGNVTVSSAKHPEVVRDAIDRKTKKTVVILSQEINPRNQNPNFPVAPQPQGTINVQDSAEALLRGSHAEGLNNVELVGDLNSNSFRLNFNQRLPDSVSTVYTGETDYEFLPPPLRITTVEPSAPPLFPAATSSDQAQVYGYPLEFYRLCTTCSHDHKSRCCTIL